MSYSAKYRSGTRWLCALLLAGGLSCRHEGASAVRQSAATRPQTASAPVVVEAPLRWQVVQPGPNGSRIQFAFPPPLDEEYKGEVTSLRGELQFPAGGRWSDLRGWFEVDTATVTMGGPDIDDNLRGSLFLSVAKFPTSRFEILSVNVTPTSASDEPATGTMVGTFRLMSRQVTLTCTTRIHRMAGDPKSLQLDATTTLYLERDFGLPTIGGPSPANGMVNLQVRAILRPIVEINHSHRARS